MTRDPSYGGNPTVCLYRWIRANGIPAVCAQPMGHRSSTPHETRMGVKYSGENDSIRAGAVTR